MSGHPEGRASLESRRPVGSPASRPTIGLLLARIHEPYQAAVWPGVADVAEEEDANLLCFVGESLRSPYGFESQANVLYDLVSTERLDGLVMMGGSLGNFISLEELRRFFNRYSPLPVVSIALAVEGVPTVLVDNEHGMREALAHLVQVHGYQRIAFIRGPAGHHEAEERFRAYTEVLAEHGMSVDRDLVVPGDFHFDSGREGIRLLLDERKAEIEAVVVAGDTMALGALEALQARGLRVPYDIAVVGFDDIEDARFSTPPLTTVRQPLYEQGREAAGLVLALIRGESPPGQVILPTRLVVRQSCGCFSDASQAVAGQEAATGREGQTPSSVDREALLAELAPAIGDSLSEHRGLVEPGWAERLWNGFDAELKGEVRGVFLPVLDEILRKVTAAGGDLNQWQGVVSALRRHVFPSLTSMEAVRHCEEMWHRARVLVGETAERAQANHRLRAERETRVLQEISEALATTVDVAQLAELVAQEVPRLGIRRCYVALYEGQGAPAPTARLILARDESGSRTLPAGGQVFPSGQLLPDGILSPGKRTSLVVEPLYFRDSHIGFALLDLGRRDGTVYQTLRGQLSSALKAALLFQERERLLADNARAVDEMQRLNQDLRRNLDTQQRLLETIRALSTPVVPLLKRVILLPLVGHIDTERARQVMERLLTGIQQHHACIAIVDITGVPLVDTSVANSLLQAAHAAKLLGAEVVLAGIRPEVAQTIVGLGVDLSGIATESNLQSGVEYALRRLEAGF